MSSESETAVKSGESNLPLKSLGKYVIERKLGQGGMGTVYLAKNSDLKKTIALKVLPQDKAQNPTLVKRFKAEAQAAARMEHPNIVAVYDSGEADGYLYIAMEYVDGLDLFEQVRRRGVVPVKRSIEIIKQVTSALQHAFEQNIVHRDIKPSNLLVRRDGTIKVTDLGLARSIDDTLETNITRAGTTVGTVDYMAPEQARSSKLADIRSDIYSLGCTWYQMLTGEPPFSEGSMTNKLQAHATKPLPDPRAINENVPEGVIAVLQRMTAKKPEDRYQTPAELLEDLANSKLTKAEFAREIFSDLSDHEISSVSDDFDEEDDAEYDDEDEEGWDDDEPSEQQMHRSKPSSKVDDESAPSSPQSVRRKSPLPPEDATDEPVRRKTRSRDVETGDVDDESSTASPKSIRRKSPLPPEGATDETVRRKTRSRDAESDAVDDTQPLKSGKRVQSKHRDEGANHDSTSTSRPTKRSNAASDHDDPNDSIVAKRRQSSSPEDEGDKSSLPRRAKTPATANEPSDKNLVKGSPKAMPPKRSPVPEPVDESSKATSELLKYFGSIAALLAVIFGVGLLIFKWTSGVEVVNHPVVANPMAAMNPNVATKQAQPAEQQDTKTANATEAAKATVTTTVNDKPPEFDLSKQPLPSWATSNAGEPKDLPVLTVGFGATSPTHFANLNEAFRAIDQNGAIIRLIGNGPFAVSSAELKSGIKLLITAATPQDQPLIFFKPNESGAVSGLSLDNGMLDLRGLHFIFDRPQDLATSSNKLVTVNDGQLFVRNCSFTASGNESVTATALSFNLKQEMQTSSSLESQLFLDRVIVRGNGLTGLAIESSSIDAVIQDTLLLTGSAPAVVLNSHQPTIVVAENAAAKPRRTIRMSRTTLCVRKVAFEVSAEFNSRPPSTSLLLQDSICSVEGSGHEAVVFSATKWPSNTANSNGWMTNLSLSSPSTLYMGFDRLMDLDKSSFRVTNVEGWQRVWGKKFDPHEFQSSFWQESAIADLSVASPQDFDSSTLPYHEIKTGSGALPGCVVSRLNVPGMVSQDRLLALGQRKKLPALLQKPIDSTPWKKVDLSKEDLGQIINKNDWPSGTVIEAMGSGIKQMSPARISGKSLRIVFRQGDGAPLKLQAKSADQKGSHDHPGLFHVELGLLDVQSATIETPQSAKSVIAPWIFSVRNASLILRGCQLSGPSQFESEQHQGLIHWMTSGVYQPANGVETPFLSINDSFLMSNGNGVRIECNQGNVFLRNSILAIRGYGLNVQPDYTEFKAAPTIDLEHVTFSATKAAVRFEAGTGVETAPAPIRFFADFCAVCTPLEFKAGEGADAALVECVGPVREQKQMQWWGSSNGVAKEVDTLLRQSNSNPIETASDWIAAWGDASEFRMLTGARGVVLGSALPNKWQNLKAGLYSLSPNCPAMTWADGGQPLGANIHEVENSIAAKKNSLETKPTGTPNSPMQSNNPAPTTTKKGLGF